MIRPVKLVALGREKHFVVITGSDTALPEAMALGVRGTVSGLSNALADLVVKVYQGVSQGKVRSEIPEAAWLTEIEGKLRAMNFPFNVGAVLAARGFDLGYPKMIVSGVSAARFETLKAEFQALYSKWKLL